MNPRAWSVGIVVPARDEAATINACLSSILVAELPEDTEPWVVVVADRCTDRTASLARQALGHLGEVLEVDHGNVGAARRAGAAAALDHLLRRGRGLDRTWLMTTDADSTVPSDWLSAHLRLARAGATAVAGTVAVASFAEHPARVSAEYAARYTVHADGTHPHVHGANLGVRADAYLDVGGWHDLATAEDHDLWRRLRAAGHASVSTIEAPVTTSGRRIGRAPDGFAGLLGDLADGRPQLTPVPS